MIQISFVSTILKSCTSSNGRDIAPATKPRFRQFTYFCANLRNPLSLALVASSSRLRCGAVVLSDWSSRVEAAVISSIAWLNAASLESDGLENPLIFRTNCSDAARISSSVTGGSKLKRSLILRHIISGFASWGLLHSIISASGFLWPSWCNGSSSHPAPTARTGNASFGSNKFHGAEFSLRGSPVFR